MVKNTVEANGPTFRVMRQAEEGTRRVGGLTAIPVLIQQLQGDTPGILEEAGVPAGLLALPENRISHHQVIRLLNVAAKRTGCRHFGLISGSAWKLADLGLLGDLMSNSPNIGRALQEVVLFQHLNSDGALAFLIKGAAATELGYSIYVPILDSTSQFYTAVMAAVVNFMRELSRPDWAPAEVLFPFSEPRDVRPYQAHFRAPLVFNSPRCALRIRNADLTHRIEGSSRETFEATLLKARELGLNSLFDAVSRSIRTLLLYGAASGDSVANSLAMHRRTLSRRLAEEGTSFQVCLDKVRMTVAKELIESSDVAIPEIASVLCYSSTESFFRAFKRWTGTTPNVARARGSG